jgi:hypothetical protein
MREVAKVPILDDAYGIYIRQAGQGNAQVFTLDYGDKLRVYDVSGSLKSSRNWSSKVRCIAVGDVDGEGNDALVGGIGKRILVVDHQGKPMWKIELESNVIACDARDVDGDDAAEVVVALQNNRVILWNDDKEALFSRRMDETISDIWLEDIIEDNELEIVVADRKGKLTILTSAGYILKEMNLGDVVIVFGVLTFGRRKLFVTGERSKELTIWDIDGNRVSTLELTGHPKALATGVADDVADTAYLVVSTDDRKLSFWEIIATSKESRSERITLQEIESTKTTIYKRAIRCGNCGAPALPEAKKCESCGAALEPLGEYRVEEFIKESIESITTKHTKIKLKDLDRILRRTLPRPAAYNLRRSLQAMIEAKEIEGYLDGNTFVRTTKHLMRDAHLPSKQQLQNVPDILASLLKGKDRIEIDKMSRETGVPIPILRKTLMILLADEDIAGSLQDDYFVLNKKQDTEQLIKKVYRELVETSS